MRSERLIRVVLAAALAAGAVGVSAEALASFRHLDRANRSWRAAEVSVTRAQGVDPAVLARVAAAVPPSATYEVVVAPRLGRTVYGQAFTALLRARLLPRIQVTSSDARWHVVWGGKVPRCCHVWSMGRVHPGDPPVLVVSSA